MKFLICTLGSYGDVNPYLALGRELQRRGHAVTVATDSFYRESVERHGLKFSRMRPEVPVDDPTFLERVMHPQRGPQMVIVQHVMPAVRQMYEDLLKPAAEADVLVSHALVYAAPLIAEKLGKRWASTVLSPLIFFSPHDMPVFAAAPFFARLRVFGPGFNGWLLRTMKKKIVSWSQPVADFRKDLGLPPGADPLGEGQHSQRLVLAMFSPRFGRPQPDWPANTVTTGFPFLDTEEKLDPALDEFLKAGEKPIVFTLGSAAVHVAGDFYDVALEVARGMGRRAVLVAGPAAADLKARIPSTQMAVEWASYAALFPHAAAVVHQGGVGTTAQALRAGVPQLIAPFAHDQFDNADRVKRMGCGRVTQRGFTKQTLTKALERLGGDTRIAARAREEGAKIRKEAGAAGAAEALLNAFK